MVGESPQTDEKSLDVDAVEDDGAALLTRLTDMADDLVRTDGPKNRRSICMSI
jgi:hypothetical protein